MPDALVTGLFGLGGVFAGAVVTGLFQFLMQKHTFRLQSVQEEQKRRESDIEREALKAGGVISAIFPWFDSLDAIVKLSVLRAQEGRPRHRPDIVEKWYSHDKQLITALSSARVISKNPQALEEYRMLSDVRSTGVTLANLASEMFREDPTTQVQGAAESLVRMKDDIGNSLSVITNKLEEAVLNWDGTTVRGRVSNFVKREPREGSGEESHSTDEDAQVPPKSQSEDPPKRSKVHQRRTATAVDEDEPERP